MATHWFYGVTPRTEPGRIDAVDTEQMAAVTRRLKQSAVVSRTEIVGENKECCILQFRILRMVVVPCLPCLYRGG